MSQYVTNGQMLLTEFCAVCAHCCIMSLSYLFFKLFQLFGAKTQLCIDYIRLTLRNV